MVLSALHGQQSSVKSTRVLGEPREGACDLNRKRDPGKCRLCGCSLGNPNDVIRMQVCSDCRHRPEARRLGPPPVGAHAGARAFTPADQALIRSMHRRMPAASLLQLLNARLEADLGPDAPRYSLDQLKTHLEQALGPAADEPTELPPDDWGALRKLLREAGRKGVLQRIDAQVIDDFAVIFGLSAAQVLHLKDVLLENGR